MAAAAGESGVRGEGRKGRKWPVACGDPMGAEPALRAPEVSHCEVGLSTVWPACHGMVCR